MDNYKTTCPNCTLPTLKLKKIKSIINPYKLQCNKSKCRKIINIRENTIFQFFSHTPISILINAIELFITEEKNAKKVIEILNERYQLNYMGQQTIYKLFGIIRKCITEYYNNVYKIEKLAYDNELKNIAIDESLFVHDYNGQQERVIGLIDIGTKNIRLELVKQRNTEILKKIILHHVGKNNTIISDGWEAYYWLRYYNYHHIVHVHGRHDFGHGNESTSHIEGIWGYLKGLIIKLYTALKPDNFYYYLKEIEFRYYIKDKNSFGKINELKEILEYCYSTNNLNFNNKDFLIDFEKLNYSDNDEEEEEENDDSEY